MEATEEEEAEAVVGENSSGTDARGNWNSRKEDDGRIEDTDKFRVLSVDKFTVEKIVLESSNGSRQVFLTKNESSKKLSLKSEPGIKIARRSRDERKECRADIKHRVSLPEGSFTSESSGESKSKVLKGAQSKLPLSRSRRGSNGDKRIKPIKLTKSPSIGSIVVAGFKSANLSGRRNKAPPKVPAKPVSKKEFIESPTSSPIHSDKEGAVFEDSPPNDSVAIADNWIADGREIDAIDGKSEECNERRVGEGADDARLESTSNGLPVEAETLDNRENENLDREAQDRLERSQSNIEVLQQNLGTKINATTAQEYKEELLGVARTSRIAKFSSAVDSNSSENPSVVLAEVTFDQDFLEKHNLDRRLKIEEKRLLETDLDYASEVEPIDGDFGRGEIVRRKIRRKPRYSKRVSEVERRWSGEFLESRLEQNSSESSKSSYVEEFGSVSSRESVLEDRESGGGGGRLVYERKRPVKFTESELSIDAVRRRTSEEALEGNSTVSTVDSDSCLEDRIKAVQEDIDEAAAAATNENREEAEYDTDGLETDHREGGHASWEEFASKELEERKNESNEIRESEGGGVNENAERNEDSTSERTVEEEIRDLRLIDRRVSSTESIGTAIVIGVRSRNDGYAKLIREFAMEAGTSKTKKEEKQKKKLGLRRLLPGFFSPKDSRKDYGKKKKKEPKEPKRHDERHFARYQQNGNYTRSPDTMNLNEDIKRNVKLDNSLNGSIIEERLDEIKRELFPDQGPITSTPDHLAQQDDDRNHLRDRSGAPRSYMTDSSLSSIAPDDRWHEGRIVHLGISPDFRKYEQHQQQLQQQQQQQRQKHEETDHRRYGQLERKHSLQEANHASRSYFFQRNHGPSGRISAPPTERYLVRPRAIHPVDRPLPAIPYSRVELGNYENYLEDEEEERTLSGCEQIDARPKNDVDVFAPVNDTSPAAAAGLILKSVSAQVKITRQPIVNQNQRAPLLGRSPKYPSPGSSQKSADYADSSCTPNSSQKSEFSVTSSKSGEYYLHSPRSTGSPNERAFEDGGCSGEGIYENEQSCSQSSRSPGRCRVDERIYDETPPSPSHAQNCSPSSKTSDRSPEDSVVRREEEEAAAAAAAATTCHQNYHASPIAASKPLPYRQQRTRSCRSNENPQRQDIEKVNRVDVDATQSHPSMTTGSQNKIMMASLRTPSSPGARASLTSRRSQPNDQILIASPKRDVTYEGRISRPSNESATNRNCGLESPVNMTGSPHCIPGVAPLDSRIQDPYGDENFSTSKVLNSTVRQSGSGSTTTGFPADIPRPEPIYGQQRFQRAATTATTTTTVQRLEDHGSTERQQDGSCQVSKTPLGVQIPSPRTRKIAEFDDRVAWVQGRASSSTTMTTTTATTTTMPKSPEERNLRATRDAIGGNSPWPGKPVSTDQQPVQSEETQRQSQQSRLEVEARRQRSAPSDASHENLYVSTGTHRQEQLYEQRSRQPGINQQRQQLMEEPIYVQRVTEPIYGQRGTSVSGPLSPSKLETRQHLEAFYWQQKALEAHRNSAVPPVNPQVNPPPVNSLAMRQVVRKIDLPEVREAVYWQQLKKLDEEQQRRIYKQNLLDESLRGKVGPKGNQSASGVSPVTANAVPRRQAPSATPPATMTARCPSTSSATSSHGDPSYWEDKVHRSKVNPAGKPPLMHTQKGQNQPVLIVRPQQAIQERREMPAKGNLDPRRDLSRQQETPRSKSASPHFHRPDGGGGGGGASMASRKTAGSPFVYEEQRNDVDGKAAPPPIFKRGSLVSGDSVEYGSTLVGPKRVSFSNQSATGSDVQPPTASWPTKHGNAPEPPTRRHRGEDSVSDTDSVFSHQDRPRRDAAGQGTEVEYDADRPLPPLPALPRDQSSPALSGYRASLADETRWNPTYGRKWPAGAAACEKENGNADAAEAMHRVLGQNEEEWNPDGKGRQSNDTGGTGRGEGETGSNEVSSGRRSGGGGVGSGGGGGGGVLGVGTGSGSIGGSSGGRSTSGGGGRSRDEPRRHTLGGDHQPSLHHQQFNAAQQLHPLHPHHLPPPHGQYGTPPTRHTTMDLEMGTKSRQRKSPLPRGYPPPSSTMLFDDDPGIMSEVETSSTGFRRGGKQRSSLPVVRTPSKTLERPLGLVFLQYRNETKRALLPNEITSIDTVKALFVRSFPKQLTMEYLDSPHVKVYIHDSNKDMFYELEDLRSHLRDIRDRSVLRLFESSDGVTGMPGPLGVPGGGTGLPPHWEDQSYFSEPEFDSEYQHQHIHKSKTAKNSTSGSSGYYMGGSSTLPRGGSLLRAYSPATSSVVAGPNATPTQPKPLTTPGGGGVPPAKPLRSYQCGKSPLGNLGGSARFSRDSSVSLYSIPDRLHGESGYMSSPERGGGVGSGSGRYPPGPYSAGSSYEDPPYYSQYSGTVTPVIDEEASDTELLEESYSLYGVKPPGRPPSGPPPRSPFPPGAPASLPPVGQSYDATRIRVDHMERQLANLTGLVQKALTHAPHTSPSPRDYLQVPAGRDPYARAAGAGDEFDKHSSSSSASLPDDSYLRTDVKPPKLGKDKSVSFEKSVSFSDEPPDMNSPKQHSPQHAADTKPTKPAIKSSTLPRMSSQERDRHKPTPPPKPAALVAGQYVYRDLALTPEMYNQLRGLQKKAKDLRQEVRNLRRMSQTQAHTVRETIRDTFITIRAMLLSGGDAAWCAGDTEKIRLTREEDLYKQEMIRLEKDLTELESTVEELRGNVINRKTRVNMSDVENMALILSKSSKTVADLKVRFPSLQEGMKGLLSSEMEKVVREEKFLKEEPERLESALRRCKKLTGTLVTLKRLASVQEQRLPNAPSVDAEETPPITPTSAQHSKATAPVPAERTVVGSASVIGGGSHPHESSAAHQQRPENALDALLDELQTFSRPSSQLGQVPGMAGTVLHQGGVGSTTVLSDIGRTLSRESTGTTGAATTTTPITTTTAAITGCRAPCISDIGRKGSVDSSSGILTSGLVGLTGAQPTGAQPTGAQPTGGTLRRLHSYPSSSDTDTSPPITRLQVSLQEQQPSLPVLPQGFHPGGQKPPVPERNAELLQLASARRVPPPPPPRTSSRSPLASPTSPQLPPRNHSCNLQGVNATLRRPAARGTVPGKEGKPPMALPPDATAIIPSLEREAVPIIHNSSSSQSSAVLSTSNSSSCESVNSQEGLQSKRGRQEQLEQRHQELLRKQKALQEQYARLQQLQRNAAGLTTVPPTPPDLLKKTGSESNLLAKMGLGLTAATSGSLTSLTAKIVTAQEGSENHQPRQEEINPQDSTVNATTATTTIMTTSSANEALGAPTSASIASNIAATMPPVSPANAINATTTTTTSKIYETDIL